MTLEDLKLYLRVDSDDEDLDLAPMLEAAQQYLKNAGVNIDQDNKLVDLCIKILVSHWYENRGIVNVGVTTEKLDYTIDNIITQLKYTGDAS